MITNVNEKDSARMYFHCSSSERAVFEAGIKLGAAYHQFVGAPVSMENVEHLEKAIEESMKIQPFVKSAKVRIDRKRLNKKQGAYDYITLEGEMLNIELEVQYDDKIAVCKLEYVEELDYPLMYVKDIRSV